MHFKSNSSFVILHFGIVFFTIVPFSNSFRTNCYSQFAKHVFVKKIFALPTKIFQRGATERNKHIQLKQKKEKKIKKKNYFYFFFGGWRFQTALYFRQNFRFLLYKKKNEKRKKKEYILSVSVLVINFLYMVRHVQ